MISERRKGNFRVFAVLWKPWSSVHLHVHPLSPEDKNLPGSWCSPEEESNKRSNDSALYLHKHQPPARHSHIYHVDVSHALTPSTCVIATRGLPKRPPTTVGCLKPPITSSQTQRAGQRARNHPAIARAAETGTYFWKVKTLTPCLHSPGLGSSKVAKKRPW